MASIRRTLSPACRHSLLPTATATAGAGASHIRPSFFIQSQKRRWRRSYPFSPPILLFFLVGFFFGLVVVFHDAPLLDGDHHHHPPPPSILLQVSKLQDYSNNKNKIDLNSNFNDVGISNAKLLIVITPTYNRPLQAYYLTRLAQTLRHVPPPLLWIVVETGAAASPETAELLQGTGLMYRHLLSSRNSSDVKDRGVHQRNEALQYIEVHRLDGIVYFADDDNIYTLELFHRLRNVRRFGTWPVAFLAEGKSKAIIEGPVCNGSQVIGWHTNEKSKRLRRFHVDMSGFAFNSTIIWDPKRWYRFNPNKIRQLDTVKEGFQETTFIEQLVEDESQMEGIPHGCSRIMNWHLHLEAKNLVYPKGWKLSEDSNAVLRL